MTVSIVIPARNEEFLQATIDDILQHFECLHEIIVGLDDYDAPVKEHEKVKVWRSPERIGMRPMINKLAEMTTGKYLMKADAHCSFCQGYDRKLIEAWQPGCLTVGIRYLLDTPTWTRRARTGCDVRYLSHPDVDPKGGLRGHSWPEFGKRYKGDKILPTMTLSGSSWLLTKWLWEDWGGYDENHGTFGQEGAEISLMAWLSGGQVLLNRDAWYAHWNRGKAPYALGNYQKQKSIAYSHKLWLGNKWPKQTHAFRWLVEKMAPVPGWELGEPSILEAPRQGARRKGRIFQIADLMDKWEAISHRLKRYRLLILKDALIDLYTRHQKGEKLDPYTHRYGRYLATHTDDKNLEGLTARGRRRVRSKFKDALRLFDNIKAEGLRAPLEMYPERGALILWKGYRRLAALHVLGAKSVPCVIHKEEIPTVKAPNQTAFRKGKSMSVRKLWNDWDSLCHHGMRDALLSVKHLLEDLYIRHQKGEKLDTFEHPYGQYIIDHELPQRHKGSKGEPTEKGRRIATREFVDALSLFDNIKANGLRAPIEAYQENGELYLWKGYRRLAVLHALGVKEVPVVIHKSWSRRQRDQALFPSRGNMGKVGPIVKRAGDHFAELGGECTDKYWVHTYTTIYDQLFAEFLPQKIRLLELGAKHGASLKLWHDVFPRASIVGLDKDGEGWKKLAGGLDRVSVMVGNQRDNEFMQTVAKRGWHIVIDDCSHDPRIQRSTFDAIWPSVKPGGWYIIEDCHYSYNERYKKTRNFVEYIASLVSQLYTTGDVREVQFHYNLCAVRKDVVD